MKTRLLLSTILAVGVGSCATPDDGGNDASGPATGTGGKSGTGGATGTGGSSSGSGGATGTGGSFLGNGGTTGSGGSFSGSGGTTGSGGSATGGGGTTGSGGATGSGGTTGSGGKGPGGTTGSGGATGTGGGSGGNVCNFASGLNIAWVNFAGDVPATGAISAQNLATFNTIFKNTHDNGGRVIRWWLHTNGTVTPGYDSSGLAQKVTPSQITAVKAILGAANSNGVAVNISLWSFDMLQTGTEGISTTVGGYNKLLLENDTNRQAYIDNYLTPLVTALKGTPGLYSYEIFNEPEGMGPNGWAAVRTTEAFIQRSVNWFAAAIHAADPNVPVTNAAVTFQYCSNVSGHNSDYSDSALLAAGGKATGKLNFYEVHYYVINDPNFTNDLSPFAQKASHWGLDKNLVMGEFYAATTATSTSNSTNVAKDDIYTYLYTNGYNGAWAWSYVADMPWPSMQVPMENLFTAHSDVGTCP
jgi:hypothetical protein